MSDDLADEASELTAPTAQEALALSKANGGASVRLPSGSIVCVPSPVPAKRCPRCGCSTDDADPDEAICWWEYDAVINDPNAARSECERRTAERVARLTAERDEANATILEWVSAAQEAIDALDPMKPRASEPLLRAVARGAKAGREEARRTRLMLAAVCKAARRYAELTQGHASFDGERWLAHQELIGLLDDAGTR